MKVTIDKFGRILIPKAVRRQLGLSAGTELLLDTNDRDVVLRPVANALVERDGLLVSTAALDRDADPFDVIDHIKAVRRDRNRELMSPGS